ncbi:MAG: UDP-2,3-diacylglucosamine diphosphatase [Candidatus Moranbacteria bacterium]|nr:UDP-2,3-diacylglucosamine diphosphatase [Candidatus Moranbacteria bacterium]
MDYHNLTGQAKMELNYKKENTIVISDFHLGSKRSKAKKLGNFLHKLLDNPPYRLILDGDVFELWSTNYKNIEADEHRVIKLVAALSEKGTKIVYIPGNHDRAFRAFFEFTFGKIKMRNEYVIRHDHKKYLVMHGDEFDAFTRNHVVISILLDQLYIVLVKINSFLKLFSRSKKSLSAEKHSKKYAEIVSRIRILATSYARSRKMDGIIIGHSHWPELLADPDGVTYVNSGDWIDSCSYVVVGDTLSLEYYNE